MGSCPHCGAGNRLGLRYCAQCGSPLPTPCPQCGAAREAQDRFCGACGTPLDAAIPDGTGAGAVGGPTVVAERRVCSVLFADLVGFTPLSEARDPEEVRELLSQYFASARTVIGRYGGVVEKFIGDAVMAVWGTPTVAEGDAERAVRAGLELVSAVSVLGEEAGVADLAARVGVVTGEVAVNLGAVGEGMVAGDAVNTAARVQAAAAPGQVWVDDATYRLAATAVGFAEVGEHSLKGKAGPVRLWAATRVLAGVGGAQRVDGLEAPLIGRDRELRAIKDLFHTVLERRSPRLVLVSGAAGVGKSRLGWEFEKYVDGLKGEVWWHRGRCLSYGDGVAFWALAEIVRQRLGIAEEDPPDRAAARLADGLASALGDPDERSYVAVRLGRLLGVPVHGDAGAALAREELFAGWRLFFERLAATSPVVMLVEDAQYADQGLLDFLDHLVDWARGVPIFVLVFARPEFGQQHAGWATGRNRTALTLDPLDAATMAELVDALVPDMRAPASTTIVERAQGVPLFAVETIRSLIDRDIVVPRDGVYRLVGDIGQAGALAVPEGLRGLLAARLDTLGPALRSLVADAAVLGSTFPAEALEAVSGRDAGEVRAALAELIRREVLEVSADKLSPQRGSFGFTHNLLRQVAYETLSRRDRKSRHLAVAAHLRATFPRDGEEVVEIVARHYQDALAAVPTDADVETIRAEAVTALVRAAQRAERSGAPASSGLNYSAAAALRVEDSDRSAAAALWELAAKALIVAGEHRQAVEYADRAREIYTAIEEARGAARADTIAGRAFRGGHELAEARARLTAGIEVLREDPDEDTALALSELGMVAEFSGEGEAIRFTEQAIVIGQTFGAGPTLMTQLLTSHAIALHACGRGVEAIALLEYAARLAERNDDSAGLGRSLLNLCSVLSTFDTRAALDAAQASVEHCRRVGASQLLATAISNLAEVQLWAGEWDAAAEVLLVDAAGDGLADHREVVQLAGLLGALRGDPAAVRRAQALDSELGDDAQSHDYAVVVDVLAALAEGNFANVLGVGLVSAPMARTGTVSWLWPAVARAADELGDAAAGHELLGLLDARPAGQVPPLLRAERDLARARLAAVEDPDSAAALFAAAVAALRAFGSPYHLAQARLDQAEFFRGTGRPVEGDGAIAEAREIAQRLRAAPLLARCDRIDDGDPAPVTSDGPDAARDGRRVG